MKINQIAKIIAEQTRDLNCVYIGTDNVWGLALAFCTGASEEGYQAIINHPEYGNGEVLCNAVWELQDKWIALMDEHEMWPVVEVPENFVFEHPSKVH